LGWYYLKFLDGPFVGETKDIDALRARAEKGYLKAQRLLKKLEKK